MGALNQFLTWSFSIFGFFIGYGMAMSVPEELKSGRFPLIVLERALFAAVFGSFFFFSFKEGSVLLVVFSSIIFLLLFFLKFKYDLLIKLTVAFLLIIFTLNSPNFFLAQTILFFLYGFPSGTLVRIRKIL